MALGLPKRDYPTVREHIDSLEKASDSASSLSRALDKWEKFSIDWLSAPSFVGKDLIRDLYMSMPVATDEGLIKDAVTTTSTRGTAPAGYILDELSSFPDTFFWPAEKGDPDLIQRFETKEFPEATVDVRKEGLTRNDPRNPNPKAPPGKQFFLHVAGRKSERGYSVLKLALRQGEEVHRRLVDALKAEQNKGIAHHPNFGRFA